MNLGKQTALVRRKSSDVGGESVTTSFTQELRRNFRSLVLVVGRIVQDPSREDGVLRV